MSPHTHNWRLKRTEKSEKDKQFFNKQNIILFSYKTVFD